MAHCYFVPLCFYPYWRSDGSSACLLPYVPFFCWCTDGSIAILFSYVSIPIGIVMAPVLVCDLMFLSLLVH